MKSRQTLCETAKFQGNAEEFHSPHVVVITDKLAQILTENSSRKEAEANKEKQSQKKKEKHEVQNKKVGRKNNLLQISIQP